MDKSKLVLVTTEFRGVFCGRVEDDSDAPNSITLTEAVNVIYWPTSVKGFLGLAATGPHSDTKLGAKAERITLYKVTSITDVSASAEAAWEAR